ncbi:FecCD family ABC transporter permease [Roseinatronobacter alkalisoli]|uniref:Iron ABC transporter permease n=1 Tax=Roseinatronobacter alkalisoli TaxID=3028235 RepID=A0ABT5TG18_9RHOB|nr:iron ABC transporter permease [Roseinatronobacter sp. HJB301]MDD7973112.1 iron ABC transporter permease [Roseinatronobacter sp. HJB301]
MHSTDVPHIDGGASRAPAPLRQGVAALLWAHQARHRRKAVITLSALILLAVLVIMDFGSGPAAISPPDLLRALFMPDTISGGTRVIVWNIRLPVALMALAVGAMLGLAGAQMQTILGNPLADPFTLGVSSSASVGAAVAITLGLSVVPVAGTALVTLNAFVFACGASLLVFSLTRIRGVTPETMILFGIALMFSANAVLGLLQYSSSESQLTMIVFWMMGSLTRASMDKVYIASGVLGVGVFFFWRMRHALTALRMGDDRAASLGVDVSRLRLWAFIVIALLAATSVAFVGVIGFVGLVGPHIARLLVGEDQRYFLPLSMIASACLLVAASILSRTITPGVIYPIGIITALIGVPFFLALVLGRRKVM